MSVLVKYLGLEQIPVDTCQVLGTLMTTLLPTTVMMTRMVQEGEWSHCIALVEHDLLLAILLLDCTSVFT